MQIWEAALLGLIQGLTEFLPISSSGHLVLAQYLLGIEGEANVTFEVFVHFGTALSIITVYRKRLATILRESILVLVSAIAKPASVVTSYRDNEPARTAINIAITLIPTGVVYLTLKDFLEARFGDPRFVCAMLIVTGVLLLLTLVRRRPKGDIGAFKAFLIGSAQAVAMLPGISRSGATICTAIYANTDPEKAANFSFLMLLPVVILATAIKSLDMFSAAAPSDSLATLAVGTLVAYISGVAAIKALLGVVRRGRLAWFALYCFIAGAVGLWLLA
jgi:undecaprenyl-diphosphatase